MKTYQQSCRVRSRSVGMFFCIEKSQKYCYNNKENRLEGRRGNGTMQDSYIYKKEVEWSLLVNELEEGLLINYHL